MATFSAVTRQNILQAIAECDSRGADDFLGVYGFEPAVGYELEHEGRTYDSRAILGVAHRYATGRLAAANEFGGGAHGAVSVLRKRGFVVNEPQAARAAAVRTAGAARAPRAAAAAAPARRSRVAPEPEPVICPTCSMTLPATGVCDYCG